MIKKRNLDPSLIQWIMTQTGLGPGIGELQYVAPATSTASQFRAQLQSMGVEQGNTIHTTPILAEASMVAGRNDIMLILPGTYTGTGAAPMTWDKDHTHMLGLCSPPKHEYGSNGVIIRTTSDDGVFAMTNTAKMCQFQNVAFHQYGEDAACLTAFREAGYMNNFRGCHFFGHIRSDVADLTTSSSLEINCAVAGAGGADVFDKCVIGGSGGAKRTGANGSLLFTGGAVGAGSDMQFLDTQFMNWMEDADPSAILIKANYGADRLMLFEGCTFYNFITNHGATGPAYVIRDNCTTTHDILLKRCARLGFDAWTSDQTYCFSADSVGATDGGQATAADES